MNPFSTLLTDKLHESSLTLKYSLWLDISGTNYLKESKTNVEQLISFDCNSYPEINQWFSRISDTIFERSEDFLPDGSHGFFGHIQSVSSAVSNMHILNTYHQLQHSWKFMLAQHAIFSAYVRLLRLIGYSNSLSSYKAVQYSRKSMEPNDLIGLDYLLRHKILKFSNLNLSTNRSKKSFFMDSATVKNYSSAYIRQLKNIQSAIYTHCNFSPALFDKRDPNKHDILADKTALDSWLNINVSPLRKILNGYKKNNFGIADYERFRSSYTALLPHDQYFLSPADNLYLRYELENMFHINMISCLFQNIKKHNENLTTDEIKILSGCCKLPNVFSRHLLIQMAFDLQSLPRIDKENFFRHAIEKLSLIVTKLSTRYSITDGLTSLKSWYEAYVHFISYIATCLCPLYETFFFWLLYSDYKAIKGDCSDEELLIDLYKILSNYLSQEEIWNGYLHPEQKICEYEKIFRSHFQGQEKLNIQYILPELPKSVSLNQAKLFKNCLMTTIKTETSKSAQDGRKEELLPTFLTQDYLRTHCESLDGYVHGFLIWNLADFDI